MIRRLAALWIGLCLCLCAICTGLAEDAAEEEIPLPADAPAEARKLPIDFSPGMPVRQDKLAVNGYSDSTIRVTITSGRAYSCEYWVADIVIADASQLRTLSPYGFDRGGEMDAVRLAQHANAVLAINGDYNDARGKRGYGVIIRQGEVYLNNLDEPSKWNTCLMDILLVDEDGDFHVLYRPQKGTEVETVGGKKVINAFTFGPVLVDDGKVVEKHNGADRYIDMVYDLKKQRMCIAQVDHLHYKVICCAGPWYDSRGMTLLEFSKVVAEQGVRVAYNLDGGDSTVLMLNGVKQNSINVTTTRRLKDIIYFASAEGAP